MRARRALLVDTSARGRILTAMAVLDDAEWRTEGIDASPGDLDAGLPARLAAALAGGAVDAVAVTLGPGSYTGVRAGIAAAAGLATGLGVPLHGVGTAELIAGAAPPGARAVWAGVDAGRGGLYVTRVALGDGLAPVPGRPERVEAASWSPPDGEPLLTMESIDARAVAGAIALAIARGRLDLTVTEPITVPHRHDAGPRV